jgi:hypothetical protein
MLVLTSFTNDKYRILKCLYDNQIKVRNNVYVALSQQEISDIMHFSKNKTNKIMQELKKEGFIDSFKNTKGKYIITNNGNIAINIIEKKY